MQALSGAALLLASTLLTGCEAPPPAFAVGGDPEEGRRLVADLDCGVCHTIPGVRGADGTVGPPLAGFGMRNLIAGTLPNEAPILVVFVRDAPSLMPGTAMPPMPLTEAQAGDVAAFLATLR